MRVLHEALMSGWLAGSMQCALDNRIVFDVYAIERVVTISFNSILFSTCFYARFSNWPYCRQPIDWFYARHSIPQLCQHNNERITFRWNEKLTNDEDAPRAKHGRHNVNEIIIHNLISSRGRKKTERE